MTKKEDELTDHNYDGIQEYDNDLPKWWVWLFYITIAWGLGYVAWYHMGPGETTEQALNKDLKEIEQLRAKGSAPAPGGDGSAVAKAEKFDGKAIYMARCFACHAADGGGSVGPNLTDKHWIHGYTREAIKKVIVEGVPAKGMMAWKALLRPGEIEAVTDFVVALKGTKPAAPKAPQGDIIEK